jgi:hypothetical protein
MVIAPIVGFSAHSCAKTTPKMEHLMSIGAILRSGTAQLRHTDRIAKFGSTKVLGP